MKQPSCVVCDADPLPIRWSDTHGIAYCTHCGAAYRVYHYEDNKRVDKPIECVIRPEWIPIMRKYWEENKRIVPCGFNFPGSNYEQATETDIVAWNKWAKKNVPKELQ